MKRILIIITTDYVPYGGLTTVMMNYYRAIDKTGLQIDFASTNDPSKVLLDELKANGSRPVIRIVSGRARRGESRKEKPSGWREK